MWPYYEKKDRSCQSSTFKTKSAPLGTVSARHVTETFPLFIQSDLACYVIFVFFVDHAHTLKQLCQLENLVILSDVHLNETVVPAFHSIPSIQDVSQAFHCIEKSSLHRIAINNAIGHAQFITKKFW